MSRRTAPAVRPGTAVGIGALVGAAAAAGLFFAPVFGLRALLVPVCVPAAVLLVAALAGTYLRALAGWRPWLTAVAGLVAVVQTALWSTTKAGLPTASTLSALAAGVTDSWRLALQSTWPARPDPDLMLFVPLLVVAAAVLGVELWHRRSAPLPALVPSFAVALLSQLFAPFGPAPAGLAALGYAALAGTLAAASGVAGEDTTPGGGAVVGARPVSDRPPGAGAGSGSSGWRRVPGLRPVLLPAAVAVLAAAGGGLLPAGPPRYGLAKQPAVVTIGPVSNPLDEIADRLAHPAPPVFRVWGATDVDRWPLVVLDNFDGANWTSGDRYQRLGSSLPPGPPVTVRVQRRTAEIATTGATGPWLPSQTWPAAVRGAEPLVEVAHGTLLLPPGAVSAARYTLTWWQPQVPAEGLAGAAIDPDAPGGQGGVGPVPPGVAELAAAAVGQVRPSFQAALALERFLRDNYRLATGPQPPTGHSWPQLTDFLLHSKRGTSEQFAAGYVALARILGIPARLTVGYRTPAGPDPDGGYTVRNGDVLAWPEVAVAGVGWVPLDPGGRPSTDPPGSAGSLAAATARERVDLPAPERLRDPPVAATAPDGRDGAADRFRFPSWPLLATGLAVPLFGWLVGVPTVRAARTRLRRRRSGPASMIGAVDEVRDRLRAYGVLVSAGMTPRDLAREAEAAAGPEAARALRELGTEVDLALWSGQAPAGTTGRAWAAVRALSRALSRRGWRARLRAALDPRDLVRPGR
ncbi:transglutaminaseTgpA domain-containing protein [Solwaraspora sp. WMMD1047]|uniref:transglutaminase family protein n=1 Tax=Solwaraspora sp. WMMD1047 TaxID=3016102 RepID=UPI0024173B05|nr:transglutaminase domain-containing protein [Solwaraspora sp. WMMD1047]MDG4831856.1 transglutaminaseTgpA domain-containing protein [Solwaraspora sp. WMMD1047]